MAWLHFCWELEELVGRSSGQCRDRKDLQDSWSKLFVLCMEAKNGRAVWWHELPSNFCIRLILFKRLWLVLILLKVSHSLWVLTHNLFQKQMKVVGKTPWWTQLLFVRHIITHVPTALGEKKAASLPMWHCLSPPNVYTFMFLWNLGMKKTTDGFWTQRKLPPNSNFHVHPLL